MAMNVSNLSSEIASGLGQGSTTSETDGFAQGIIDELTTNGVASTGSPSGTISGLTVSSMANLIKTVVGYPSVSSELTGFCQGIIDNLQNDGSVSYPSSPHTNGGTIINIDGTTTAGYIKDEAGYPSVSSELQGFADAVADHIKDNASCDGGSIS